MSSLSQSGQWGIVMRLAADRHLARHRHRRGVADHLAAGGNARLRGAPGALLVHSGVDVDGVCDPDPRGENVVCQTVRRGLEES
jgi:hypothetical protein